MSRGLGDVYKRQYKDFVQETTGIVSGVHSQMVQLVKNFDGS